MTQFLIFSSYSRGGRLVAPSLDLAFCSLLFALDQDEPHGGAFHIIILYHMLRNSPNSYTYYRPQGMPSNETREHSKHSMQLKSEFLNK